MEHLESHRERYNLYYIFQADKLSHPMPPEMLEKIRKHISEKARQNKKIKFFSKP